MPKSRIDSRDRSAGSAARTRSRTAPRDLSAADALTAELAALPSLPRKTLQEHWQILYGAPPPSHLARGLLVRAIAYRIQEQALGGLDLSTRRRLAQATRDVAAGRAPASPAAIKPGTRLLREWRGVMHEVIVLEHSVQYRGESWPSLSAVAREITGARWSGPRFFGLKRHRRDGR